MIRPDKKMAVIMAVPFLALLVGIALVSTLNLVPPVAVGVIGLDPVPQERVGVLRQSAVVAALNGPFRIQARPQKGFPRVSLSEIAPPPSSKEENVLSFVLVSGNRKMAIINGIVVKEGDKISNARVSAIEKNRVLLRDGKKEEWLNVQ